MSKERLQAYGGDPLKVYLAGSIRGLNARPDLLVKLAQELKDRGAEVLSETLFTRLLEVDEQTRRAEFTHREIFERDTAWIRDCDVMVVFRTGMSEGVGYEIGCAQSLKKPIIILNLESIDNEISPMVSGNPYLERRIFNSSRFEVLLENCIEALNDIPE